MSTRPSSSDSSSSEPSESLCPKWRATFQNAPTRGDIIWLPRDVPSDSLFARLHADGLFGGNPLDHPQIVLEVNKNEVLLAQCTSFTDEHFNARVRCDIWAERYCPIGHDNHPLGSPHMIELSKGKMRKSSYANSESLLIAEWRHCRPFTGRDHKPIKVSFKGLRDLEGHILAWNHKPGEDGDHWRTRRWLATERPDFELSPRLAEQIARELGGERITTTTSTTTTSADDTRNSRCIWRLDTKKRPASAQPQPSPKQADPWHRRSVSDPRPWETKSSWRREEVCFAPCGSLGYTSR